MASLFWATIIDDPRHRPAIQSWFGTPQNDRHVLFSVCILGNAFIDIEACLVAGIDFIDKTFNPVALSLKHICVSTLVNLPAMVTQLCAADEFASRASSLHLLQVKIAPVGKVVFGDALPGVGRRGSIWRCIHVEDLSEAASSVYPMGEVREKNTVL